MQTIDPWLASLRSAIPSPHTPSFDVVSREFDESSTEMSETIRCSYLSAQGSGAPGMLTLHRAASDKDSIQGTGGELGDDLLRCFSVLVDSPPPVGFAGKNASSSQKTPTMPICQRITSMQTYMSMNRYWA